MKDQLPAAPPLNAQDHPIFEDVSLNTSAPSAPPREAIASAIPAAAAEARSAAVLSPPFMWQGKPLYPFTPFRESWWRYIRKAGFLPSLTEVHKDPREFAQDAAIILWLCLHDVEEWGYFNPPLDSPAEVESHQWFDYRRDLALFATVCAEWGNKEIGFDLQEAAAALAMDIHNRAHITRAVSANAPTASSLGE